MQHCDDTPMQYTAIFHGCKNYNFLMKNCDIMRPTLKKWEHIGFGLSVCMFVCMCVCMEV